ncbi:hypothetical protein C5O19_11150 [Siphonobacter curvatus]|uniref:Uncharacterized protein n=1 Tax=Siphonobacter curvatus TaxID=2094562 RepID=A0A2S7IQZ7_9BACT|nr:hypothetical protein C5O19_11150 [Siphonobacter curvatus]
MLSKNIHISFREPVPSSSLDTFKEILSLSNLEIKGDISSHKIEGIIYSYGMFNLFKAPLVKALELSHLKKYVKEIMILQ